MFNFIKFKVNFFLLLDFVNASWNKRWPKNQTEECVSNCKICIKALKKNQVVKKAPELSKSEIKRYFSTTVLAPINKKIKNKND